MAKVTNRKPYDCVCPPEPALQEYIDPKLFPGFGPDDAGKVLGVNENGEWCCREGGGGTSVPKPLTQEYLPEGYPYIKEETGVLISTTGDAIYEAMATPLGLTAGETYTVEINGVLYTGTAVAMDFTGLPVVAMGDVYTISGGEVGTAPTGDPYALIDLGASPMEGMYWTFEMLDGSAAETLVISGTKKEIATMSPELLPPTRKTFVVMGGDPTSGLENTQEEVLVPMFTADDVVSAYRDGLIIDMVIKRSNEQNGSVMVAESVFTLDAVITITNDITGNVNVASFSRVDLMGKYLFEVNPTYDSGFRWAVVKS